MPGKQQTSGVTGPRRRAQAPGRPPQQPGNRQSEPQHHQAQETQAVAETVGDALDRGEPAQDGRGFLLQDRPALSALSIVVGDAGLRLPTPRDGWC